LIETNGAATLVAAVLLARLPLSQALLLHCLLFVASCMLFAADAAAVADYSAATVALDSEFLDRSNSTVTQ